MSDKIRVVKEAEERRNEILDAAEKLFAEKGFDHTSTNDILEQVGIARGTLYYHFRSKEEILDAAIERLTGQLVAQAAQVAADRTVPVLQRLTKTIMALNMENDFGHEVVEQMHRPQNALLHQKMQEQLLTRVTPLITGLIEEGIEQGICRTDYPAETVEMVLYYSDIAFDTGVQCPDEIRMKKMEAFIYNVERLFDMERGSMKDTVMPIFEQNFPTP